MSMMSRLHAALQEHPRKPNETESDYARRIASFVHTGWSLEGKTVEWFQTQVSAIQFLLAQD